MDNKVNTWKADTAPMGAPCVKFGSMVLCVTPSDAEANWIAQRLNYAANAEAQLAALGASRIPIGPTDV